MSFPTLPLWLHTTTIPEAEAKGLGLGLGPVRPPVRPSVSTTAPARAPTIIPAPRGRVEIRDRDPRITHGKEVGSWPLFSLFSPSSQPEQQINDLVLINDSYETRQEWEEDPELSFMAAEVFPHQYAAQISLEEIQETVPEKIWQTTYFLKTLPGETQLIIPERVYEKAWDMFCFHFRPKTELWIKDSSKRWRMILLAMDSYIAKRMEDLSFAIETEERITKRPSPTLNPAMQIPYYDFDSFRRASPSADLKYDLAAYRQDYSKEPLLNILGFEGSSEDALMLFTSVTQKVEGLQETVDIVRTGTSIQWMDGTSNETEIGLPLESPQVDVVPQPGESIDGEQDEPIRRRIKERIKPLTDNDFDIDEKDIYKRIRRDFTTIYGSGDRTWEGWITDEDIDRAIERWIQDYVISLQAQIRRMEESGLHTNHLESELRALEATSLSMYPTTGGFQSPQASAGGGDKKAGASNDYKDFDFTTDELAPEVTALLEGKDKNGDEDNGRGPILRYLLTSKPEAMEQEEYDEGVIKTMQFVVRYGLDSFLSVEHPLFGTYKPTGEQIDQARLGFLWAAFERLDITNTDLGRAFERLAQSGDFDLSSVDEIVITEWEDLLIDFKYDNYPTAAEGVEARYMNEAGMIASRDPEMLDKIGLFLEEGVYLFPISGNFDNIILIHSVRKGGEIAEDMLALMGKYYADDIRKGSPATMNGGEGLFYNGPANNLFQVSPAISPDVVKTFSEGILTAIKETPDALPSCYFMVAQQYEPDCPLNDFLVELAFLALERVRPNTTPYALKPVDFIGFFNRFFPVLNDEQKERLRVELSRFDADPEVDLERERLDLKELKGKLEM